MFSPLYCDEEAYPFGDLTSVSFTYFHSPVPKSYCATFTRD